MVEAMVCDNIKHYFSKKTFPVKGEYKGLTVVNQYNFSCNMLDYAFEKNKYVNFLFYLGTGPNSGHLTGT